MLAWFYLQIANVNGFTTQGFDRPAGLSTETSFVILLGTILNWFLGFVGTVAFIMFVWAGLSFVISRGNPEKIKKARTIMLYSVLGIGVILLSYAAIFTITYYLATGHMTANNVATGVSVAPPAVPVSSSQDGIILVNPTTLGKPQGAHQVPAATAVDSKLIQVNPSTLGSSNPRNAIPVGDSIQANPIR